MAETRTDGFLGGRLAITQPVRGYRSGADAVMLAAACAARSGDSVLDLGCGAGVASLCLGWRVAGLTLAGLERQPAYAALAGTNAAANRIPLRVITGDLAALPAELRAQSFDHVIANPPYFIAGTPAPEPGRAGARHEDTQLVLWVEVALRRLRPGGRLVLIQRAERLAHVLAAIGDRAGEVAILPIAGRAGQDAGRVIIGARKGARGDLRLHAPLIMHAAPTHAEDAGVPAPRAEAILREGQPINLW